MIELDLNGLIDLLHERKGAQPITIVTQTIPAMNKTGNPYYDKDKGTFRVYKRSWVNGMIGWNYSNAVSNQRAREDHPEPAFEAQPRKWGERIAGSPLVKHKDSLYLELKVERSVETPLYYLDDELLDEDDNEQGAKNKLIVADIKSWIKVSTQAATQETEKEIILRDYKLSNIISIRCGGCDYRVKL